ncbi:MAG: sulfurtransferase-like selenium metabolism protein YedF [Clostridium sp.]|uniref:sulfurtransferase-like selenium metabolism protein YedF n=1 Tax=Clostridium sp. TaxID=1506 RepID=UPI003F30405C
MNRVDCRGLDCPKPVVETKKYFEAIDKGIGVILVDNEIANTNVTRFAEGAGFIVNSELIDGIYEITIEKKEKKEEVKNDGFSILVTTDKLGEGNDELGKTLMKSYLYALSEAEDVPEEIIFLNGGVKLTCGENNVIESIKEVERKGAKIISCGACLDFYSLKEELKIGEVGNMYSIVEITNKKRIVKI